MKRAARATGMVVLAGWVLIALAVVLFSFGPRVFGHQVLIVRSGSMEPAIMTGSVVVVQPVSPNALKVGDVITFEPADGTGKVVTHRIVEVVEESSAPTFRTKGDANNALDAFPVRYVNTGWRVIGSVPYAGYLFNTLSRPEARAVLVGVPALLLGASFLRDVWRKPSR